MPFVCLALGVSAIPFASQLVFLPDLPQAVSGNGRYVLVSNYRVDATNGAKFSFPSPYPFWGLPRLISEDGKSIVSELISGELGETQIYRLNDNGTNQPLSNDGGSNASPNFMSANASTVSGEVIGGGGGTFQGYRWINGSPASIGDYVGVVSGDGDRIFGESWGAYIYWEGGFEFVMSEDGWDSPRVTAASWDGHTAVGYYGARGFRWVQGSGYTDLGNLPGGFANGSVRPTSVTYDGLFTAGYEDKTIHQAFIHRPSTGMQRLTDFLYARGISTSDWWFEDAYISGNGEAIVGRGLYKQQPRGFHVWIAGNHLTVNSMTSITPAGRVFPGTVSFATTSPNARVVNLSTSSPDVVVPATVTIPANQSKVNFSIQVNPNVAGGKVSIHAQADQLQSSYDINIQEPIKSVVFSPTRIHGGKYSKCTVSLNHPLRATTQFRFANPPSQGLTVPFAINVPAGASSFSFNAISPGYQVNALETYQIKVYSPYHPEKGATLQVFPPIGWMTVYPTQIKGGTTGLGRIGTTLAAGVGGLRYTLRSLSSLISVPSQVSIPEGGTQCQFNVNTLPVTASAVRQIEARTAYTVKTVNVTLVP